MSNGSRPSSLPPHVAHVRDGRYTDGLAATPHGPTAHDNVIPLEAGKPKRSKSHQAQIRKMRRVKSARFNASKRLEKRHEASITAFAMAGVFGFVLPVFALIFTQSVSEHLKNVLEFTGYVAGALSLVIGLTEQARDYKPRAHALHRCGLRVNSVVRRLEISTFRSDEEMASLINAYDKALEDCPENHNDIDFDLALMRERLAYAEDEAERLKAKREMATLEWRAWFEIYWLYLIVWIAPIITGALVWAFYVPG